MAGEGFKRKLTAIFSADAYEFLGDKTMKNIVKPVGAYRVVMQPKVTVAVKSKIQQRSGSRHYVYSLLPFSHTCNQQTFA